MTNANSTPAPGSLATPFPPGGMAVVFGASGGIGSALANRLGARPGFTKGAG
ncbi:MAG: hypothetical protein ACKOEC_04175 [Acidimicrobiia bacterium]